MDNTVGSLTQIQKSVIIGSILGDGYLRRMKNRKDAYLEINHSYKAKEYVDWKYSILEAICVSPPVKRMSGKDRLAYWFYTKQHPDLTQLWMKFYSQGKKIIPSIIVLNPLILAIWFMDDGSKSRKFDVYLNTQQFTLKDQRKLLQALRRIHIHARLNKDKQYFRIRILKESVERFNSMINPYIIPSMKYKLSYDPVETSDYESGSVQISEC